jgi:Na+/melibiose symporter-like transporter
MEIASYIAGAIAVILGLICAALFEFGHKDVGLWTTGAAIIAVVITGCCWCQDLLWKRDNRKPDVRPISTERARISVNDFRIITAETNDQFTYTVILKNYGKLPARIVEQSFTYMCGATDADVPDKPVYFVVGKAGRLFTPIKN